MNAGRSTAVPPLARPRRGTGGFTLLEVLVSLLIVAGALAGIAALLPAAGARLADATEIDRAATMAANARADVLNRGLIRFQLWQQATGTTPGTRAIVFGDGLTIDGAAVALTSATSTIALAGPTAVAQRIDPATGFRLRDNVLTSATGAVVITGTDFEPGICYGCMLSSTAVPTGPGAPVRMSTVVFRRPAPAVLGLALTGSAGLPLRVSGTLLASGSVAGLDLTTTDGRVAAAGLRKRYLGGCSWVLALPAVGGEPRWVQIASSWTDWRLESGVTSTGYAASGTSSVMLSGTEWHGLLSGTTLRVVGFEGLLRVDERRINLE